MGGDGGGWGAPHGERVWGRGPGAKRGIRGIWVCAGAMLTRRCLPRLTQIYADPAKRLELYFRPKDPYCHPVCANRFPTSTVLLKVKRRTRKTKRLDTEDQTQPEVQFEMEILGTVTTVYKFQGNTWICVRVASRRVCLMGKGSIALYEFRRGRTVKPPVGTPCLLYRALHKLTRLLLL